MTINKKLLRRFLHDYPFQPATAVWRATEIDHVIAYPFPEGFGLDLGCGDAQLTQIILESVGTRSMVGIDIDPQEAALAEKSGIYERIHITPADQIPEKDSCFDWVFSNSVLEHIPNLDDVIAEVSRLLRPGGQFLLTVPGDKFHQCLGGPVLPWVSLEEYRREVDERFACLRYWSVKDWENHLLPHGLQIERATEYQTASEVRRWETIARYTSGIIYGLMKRSKQPIEIQRSLGVRKASAKMPWFLARILANLLSFNLDKPDSRKVELMGGLMILARKI